MVIFRDKGGAYVKKIVILLSLLIMFTGCQGKNEVIDTSAAVSEIQSDTTSSAETTDSSQETTAETTALTTSAVTTTVAETTVQETSGVTSTTTKQQDIPATTSARVVNQAPLITNTKNLDDSQRTLRICTFNEEFKDLFEEYYLKDNPLPKGYSYEFVISNPMDYYDDLPYDLLAQSNNIDLFICEPDYMAKYAYTDDAKDLLAMGMKKEEFNNQYPYALALGTDGNEIKGSCWNAEAGVFTYRRSIAKEIFGTDDPATIGSLLSDWDKFKSAGEKVSQNRKYQMLAGYYDLFIPVCKSPIYDNGQIFIDQSYKRYADLAHDMYRSGAIGNIDMWTEDWVNFEDGKFGYFTPDWMISGVMKNECNRSYGDWAVCAPPQSFYWGGSYICVSSNCDTDALALNVIRYFTTKSDSMTKVFVNQIGSFPNNKIAVQNIINSDNVYYKETCSFLGGQNYYQIIDQEAKKIPSYSADKIDMDLADNYNYAMKDYIHGYEDYDSSLQYFYDYSN